ncbi:Wzz/FepE/Etk N-terminal domain-containing protein [Modicisalibacter xianhensis]|uniref:Chain length determinant protein n=1 Tax=Modicisalibacter xianhensis TaxID=442341 RepID=A0A1I3C792_9GAMM|nr:Wzz/FepE/Etk N-terminal domain-containing protein [Halomonas xianhensis]SFH70273.1 Chain length determinant protein [Halomonas xianhensis]
MTPQDNSTYRQYDDEISLVDLATILVRRWKAMAIIFVIIVGLALAYAILAPRSYSYSSIYNVAEKAPGAPLESPESLVAKAKNLYLGPVTRELLAKTGLVNLPFDVRIENPEETLLVTLSSQASEADQEIVAQLHEGVLARLQQGQQSMVERQTEALKRQLESARQSLETIRGSESLGAAEVTASIMGRIANLEAELEELTGGDVGQTAVQSLEPAGTSRIIIVALAIVLGAILAITGAFLLQFSSLVRSSLKENG